MYKFIYMYTAIYVHLCVLFVCIYVHYIKIAKKTFRLATCTMRMNLLLLSSVWHYKEGVALAPFDHSLRSQLVVKALVQ